MLTRKETQKVTNKTHLHQGYTEIVPIPCNVATWAPPPPGFAVAATTLAAFSSSTPNYDSSNSPVHSPSFSVSPVSCERKS